MKRSNPLREMFLDLHLKTVVNWPVADFPFVLALGD